MFDVTEIEKIAEVPCTNSQSNLLAMFSPCFIGPSCFVMCSGTPEEACPDTDAGLKSQVVTDVLKRWLSHVCCRHAGADYEVPVSPKPAPITLIPSLLDF